MKLDHSIQVKKHFGGIYIWDVAAIVLLTAFAIYHIYLAHIGFHNPDEVFYLTIPHRLLLGDSLITDEWHLCQFSSLFQYLPFWAFYRITGSTDGIVLYSRYVFIVAQTLFGIYLYRVLRSYKWSALISLFFYLRFLPFITLALNYYTMSIMFAIIIGVCFFLKPANTKPRQVLCGIAYASLVLVEPFTVILYPIYSVIVIVENRKKRKVGSVPTCWSKTFWLWATVGISMCAVLFFIVLFSRASIYDILKAIPKLLQDSEYPLDEKLLFVLSRFVERDYSFLQQHISCFWICFVLFFLLVIIAAIISFRGKLKYRNTIIFCSLLILIWMISSTVQSWPATLLVLPFDWQFACFGLICYLLTLEKEKKLFSFYLFGLIFAICLNITSEVDIGIGMIVPAIISPQICYNLGIESNTKQYVCSNCIGDFRSFSLRKRSILFLKQIFSAKRLIAVSLCVVLATHFLFLKHECHGDGFFDTDLGVSDSVLQTEMICGPYRGIKTTEERAKVYADIISDLDVIRAEMHSGDVFYIANLMGWGYLYLDVTEYSPYTTYFVTPDLEKRQFTYWEMHPEKTPDYVYLPDVFEPGYDKNERTTNWTLRTLQNHFICQITKGKSGYILHIIGLNET